MNIKRREEEGFTIIEVVLVLAIAGLIFMMVFIALPALQRGQRDTSRKNDIGRLMTAVTNYSANNRGALPTFDDDFITNYLLVGSDTFLDPAGAGSGNSSATTYQFATTTTGANTALSAGFSEETQNIIYPTTGATCGAGGATVSAGSRKFAIRIYLEGGGVYCTNN